MATSFRMEKDTTRSKEEGDRLPEGVRNAVERLSVSKVVRKMILKLRC